MNGHVLLHTDIAVDYWKIKGSQESYIHFLTHVHGDHIVGLTSSWTRPIYCSDISAMILEEHHGISKHLLKIIPLQEKIILTSKSGPFTVMAFDANHCPGAIMLHFQGNFGSIFYCGDFRKSTDMISECSQVAKNADILYLDNTFCDERCHFPPRNECFAQILDIVKGHPKHRVAIGLHSLGKEVLLGELGATLNETIVVSPKCYQLCRKLFDTNVFVTPFNCQNSRIWAVPVQLKYQAIAELKEIDDNVIVIIPTAKFTGLTRQPFSSLPHVYIVPYSDHSSYPELLEFVAAMQPKYIKPIVDRPGSIMGTSLSHRADMACFNHLLSDSLVLDQTPTVLKESSELLINQTINCDEESSFCKLTTDSLSTGSKRVFKRVNQTGPEVSSAINASGDPDNFPAMKLASFLKPLLIGKAKKRLKTFGTYQKRKRTRSKIKSKGVVYIEEDESLSVKSDLVPLKESLSKKGKGHQETASSTELERNNHRRSGPVNLGLVSSYQNDDQIKMESPYGSVQEASQKPSCAVLENTCTNHDTCGSVPDSSQEASHAVLETTNHDTYGSVPDSSQEASHAVLETTNHDTNGSVPDSSQEASHAMLETTNHDTYGSVPDLSQEASLAGEGKNSGLAGQLFSQKRLQFIKTLQKFLSKGRNSKRNSAFLFD